MKSKINLVAPKSRKKSTKQLNFIVLITFLISFGFALMILSYVFTLNSTLSSLRDKKSEITQKISQISEKRDRQIFIKDRLSSIEKVIAGRKKLDEKLLSILSIFPQKLQISSINAKPSVIGIKVESESLLVMDDFLNKKIFEFAKSEKMIQKISMNSFSVLPSGLYAVGLDFNLTDTINK